MGIHIVRPHLDEDVKYRPDSENDARNRGKEEDVRSRPHSENDVRNKPKEGYTREQPQKRFEKGQGKNMPGKLDQYPRKVGKPMQKEVEGKKLTDFDEIMRRRKNHVDTLDNTGRLLGALSSAGDNVHATRKRSKLWIMVRECLKTKSYLMFANKRMSTYR